MKPKKTLKFKYPQWRGDLNPNYIIALPNTKDEQMDIPIDTDYSKIEQMDGIEYGEPLLNILNQIIYIIS